MRTTVGQLLVNEALPEDLRDYSRKFDKAGMGAFLSDLAANHPKRYNDVAKSLLQVGSDVSHMEGSSFSIRDLRSSKAKQNVIPALRARVQEIAEDDSLTQRQKDDLIVAETSKLLGKLDEAVMLEGTAANNPLAIYAASGAKGGKSQVNQMLGAPLMVSDHRGRPIPVPILRNFSEGLDPAELWATTYGVRRGYVDLKTATPKAGFFSKQLANAAHKLIVNAKDPLPGTGLPVDTNDPDNEGAVLARSYGPYKEGTIITPRIMKALRRKHPRILIHSPISSPAPGGGVSRKAAGVRERGGLPNPGEFIGIAAAQAITEPLAQAAISSKHVAGVAGASGKGGSAEAQAGFDVVNQLANIPKHVEDRAPVTEIDGHVSKVEDAPQGGKYVYVGEERYYVSPAQQVTVKPGQALEAGDTLSDGLPNPSDIVRLKGIGEGRRYFADAMYGVLKNSGVSTHRRNVELMSRALINHVRLRSNGSVPGGMIDDIVEYDDLATQYVPRKGARAEPLAKAKNKYLEQPVLHYSVGTRVTPRVEKTLKEHKINQIMVHDSEPDFVPEMQRAMDVMNVDPDWQTRLGGFYLQKNFLNALHRGMSSDEQGLSYIPATAKGEKFSP